MVASIHTPSDPIVRGMPNFMCQTRQHVRAFIETAKTCSLGAGNATIINYRVRGIATVYQTFGLVTERCTRCLSGRSIRYGRYHPSYSHMRAQPPQRIQPTRIGSPDGKVSKVLLRLCRVMLHRIAYHMRVSFRLLYINVFLAS